MSLLDRDWTVIHVTHDADGTTTEHVVYRTYTKWGAQRWATLLNRTAHNIGSSVTYHIKQP